MFVHCNANLINLWETEVSLFFFYALLVDFFTHGAVRPQHLGVFRYRFLGYACTWDCSSMLNLRKMSEDRTIFDLSDEEFEDYENNPKDWEEVTENTNQDALDMMFPNGMDDD